jgi:hypothetical protein
LVFIYIQSWYHNKKYVNGGLFFLERNNLASLVCGDYTMSESLKDLYQVLYHNISNMENRLWDLAGDTNSNVTVLGPYYARNLLETSCTALLGRIDPFRILFIQKVQSLEGFGLGSRSNGAICWFGDIFEQGLSATQREPNKMWSPQLDFSKVGRGLLGDYYGQIFWNPSFKKLIDNSQYQEEACLEYYRLNIRQIDSFIIYIRQKASSLYSSLSKGIHSELVVKPEIIYDRTTVLELVSDVIGLCSILGIVSHNIDSSICRLPCDNAFEHFRQLMEWRETYGE